MLKTLEMVGNSRNKTFVPTSPCSPPFPLNIPVIYPGVHFPQLTPLYNPVGARSGRGGIT